MEPSTNGTAVQEPTPTSEIQPVPEPQQAPATPSSTEASPARPSFLARLLNREPKREAAGEVQEPEPEHWKSWSKEEFTRFTQSLRDQGATDAEKRSHERDLAAARRDLDAAIAADDEYNHPVAPLVKRLRALENNDPTAPGLELDRFRDQIVGDYDRDTIAVWEKKLGLEPFTFKGPRSQVSEQLIERAIEYGGAQLMDELRTASTPEARSFLLEIQHRLNAGEEPVHIEGRPAGGGPPRARDMDELRSMHAKEEISNDEYRRQAQRLQTA